MMSLFTPGNNTKLVLPILVTSAAAFTVLSRLLKYVSIKQVRTHGRDEWVWRNSACSLFHAIFSGAWTFYCCYTEPITISDITQPGTDLCMNVFAFSLGYFIYDVSDIISYDRGRQWQVMVHHAAAMLALVVPLTQQRYTGLVLLALLMEFNNVNLHARKMLRLSGKADSILYILNWIVLAFTMIFCRILLCGYIILHIWRNFHLLSQAVRVVYYIGVVVVIPTNVGLFYRVWVTDVLKRAPKDGAKLVVD